MNDIEYPRNILFEIDSDLQHKSMIAFHKCFQEKTFHIDKFLIWVIKNVNVEQSIFLRQYNEKKVNK